MPALASRRLMSVPDLGMAYPMTDTGPEPPRQGLQYPKHGITRADSYQDIRSPDYQHSAYTYNYTEDEKNPNQPQNESKRSHKHTNGHRHFATNGQRQEAWGTTANPPSSPTAVTCKPPRQRTISARSHRSIRPYSGNSSSNAQFQDIIELAKVSANFATDLDSQYATGHKSHRKHKRAETMMVSGQGIGKESEILGFELVLDKQNGSSKQINFDKVPIMLLPKARPRGREDFMGFIKRLRENSVIANDPRSQMILSSNGGGLRPLSAVSAVSHDSSEVDVVERVNRSVSLPPENYIETFADYRDLIKGAAAAQSRKRLKQIQNGQRPEQMDWKDLCPHCLKLFENNGGRQKLIQWVIEKWAINRQENLQIPKANNVAQGNVPHFCNFVQKLQLSERSRTIPQPDHCHVRKAFEDTDGHGTLSRDGTHEHNHAGHGRPVTASTQRKKSIVEEDLLKKAKEDAEREEQERQRKLSHDYPLNGRSSPPPPSENKENHESTQEAVAIIFQNNNVITHPNENISNDGDRIGIIRVPSPEPTPQALPAGPTNAWAGDSSNTNQLDLSPSNLVEQKAENVQGEISQGKGRPAVKKKEKKPFERKRNIKEEAVDVPIIEEVKIEEEIPKVIEEEIKPQEPPKIKEVPKVPELPKYEPPKKEHKAKPRPSRGSIAFIKPMAEKAKEDTVEASKPQKKEYDFAVPEIIAKDDIPKRVKAHSWLQGRLALSQQASRFELPMDMKELETMTPQEYLTKFCVVTSRRGTMYQKVYQKYKNKTGGLDKKDLEKALKEVLTNTIKTEHVHEIYDLVQLKDDDRVDYTLFAGIAALAERILYQRFLTEDTNDMKDHQKEQIECADFCALDWKFHGVHVNPQMRLILEKL